MNKRFKYHAIGNDSQFLNRNSVVPLDDDFPHKDPIRWIDYFARYLQNKIGNPFGPVDRGTYEWADRFDYLVIPLDQFDLAGRMVVQQSDIIAKIKELENENRVQVRS